MTSPVWTPARYAMDFARDLMGFEAGGLLYQVSLRAVKDSGKNHDPLKMPVKILRIAGVPASQTRSRNLVIHE
jgi:hypothetical protein